MNRFYVVMKLLRKIVRVRWIGNYRVDPLVQTRQQNTAVSIVDRNAGVFVVWRHFVVPSICSSVSLVSLLTDTPRFSASAFSAAFVESVTSTPRNDPRGVFFFHAPAARTICRILWREIVNSAASASSVTPAVKCPMIVALRSILM